MLYAAACTTTPANKTPSAQAAYEPTHGAQKPGANRKTGSALETGAAPDKDVSVGTVETLTRGREASAALFPGTGKFIDTKAASRRAYTTTAEGDLTLNFQGSDIQDVIKTILGDILHVNYTIDEKIKGQVYLQTSEPIGPKALIPTLETLLRMKGAVLVRSDHLYKIIPQSAALSSAVSPQVRLLRDRGFQILVVPLRYIAAQEMEKILKPLQPANSLVHVDGKRNLLILAGTQVELAHLLKTVKIFDIDQLEGMSVGLFRLSSIDTKTILGELEQVFGDGADSGIAGMLRFVPIERLNALLVITPQEKYLKDAQLWIERLDHAEESATVGLHVYYVQNGRAAHLAELLGQLFEEKAASVESPPIPKLAPGAKPAIIETDLGTVPAKQQGNPNAQSKSSTGAINIQAGTNPREPSKEKAKRGIDGAVTASMASAPSASDLDVGTVTIIADDENNALIVKATSADYAKVERAIRKLDILPLQVLVEATIVDVELTDEFSYGLEWFFKSRHGDKRIRGILDFGEPGLAPIVPGFSYTVVDSADIVRGVLNTLASESKLDVISSPSLMVLDNSKATIKVGDQVPVRTSEATSIETSGADTIIASTIQYQDTGVLLEVSPRVNASGMVVMDITQEVNTVEVTTTSGIDSPTINQRRIDTTVAVQSGKTIVLGGLIRETKSKSNSGVPGLRKIPVLGWLFGTKRKAADRSELLVLITPTAIKDQGEALAITDELREKMTNLTLPEWLSGPEEPKKAKPEEPKGEGL